MDLTNPTVRMSPGEHQRWFGATATMYEPGTGRIVAAVNTAATGVQVTVETALSIPAFFHGLRTIAQTVGILDFDVIHHLVQKNAEGIEQRRQEIATRHPVHILLHSEPNEFQDASEWRETMIAHAITTGNGFSYIERNGNFRPTALLPLMPDRTKPIVIAGVLSYVTMVNNEQITLDPWNVFHLKGFSWNGVAGMPLIQLMRQTLGLDIAQSRFTSAFFGNGCNLDGVVTYPGALSDIARQNLKSSMRREYAGVANAFRTIFLEEGMKFEKIGVEPDKAQLIEGRKFSLGDMARVIGLPPHLLYDLSQSTNNNIEHQGIEAVTYAFRPWTNKFTQQANRKLLYESEKFDYSTRLDTNPLMAGDSTAQAAHDQSRFNTASTTPNEIRAKDGKNPIEGGDVLFVNTAILPLNLAVARANAQTARLIAASSTAPALTITPTSATVGENMEADEDDDTPPGPGGTAIKPADNIPGPEVPKNLIEDQRAMRTDRPHSYSCVMAPIGGDAGKAMKSLAASIPDDELADDGREGDPHATLLYGLHDDSSKDVRTMLGDEPPITMTLGKTKVFPANEKRQSDVIVVAIDSPDLHRLNAKLKTLPFTSNYPDYSPHATIAYVKPGLGQKYAGRTVYDGTVTSASVTHSNSKNVKIKVPLGSQRAMILGPVVRYFLTRICNREEKAIRAALKKHSSDLPAFRTWYQTWETQQRSHIDETLKPSATDPAYTQQHLAQSRTAVEQILAAKPADREDAAFAVFSTWPARIESAATSLLESK